MIATSGRVTALLVGIPFVLAAAGWEAFSMVGLFAQSSDRVEASYPWSGGDISLQSSSGYVHVVVGSGNEVGVSYTEHYQLKKPKVTGAVSGSGVQLNAKCPGGIFANNCDISYTLTVPAAANLVIHTGDGGIEVTESAGDLTLSTGDGGILLDAVTGTVDARTGDGGIRARALHSPSVQAKTGDGGIVLGFDAAPSHVSTSTGDGGIDIGLPNGTGPYNVTASTGNGGKSITVPTDPNSANLITAHTGDGGIAIGYLRPLIPIGG